MKINTTFPEQYKVALGNVARLPSPRYPRCLSQVCVLATDNTYTYCISSDMLSRPTCTPKSVNLLYEN